MTYPQFQGRVDLVPIFVREGLVAVLDRALSSSLSEVCPKLHLLGLPQACPVVNVDTCMLHIVSFCAVQRCRGRARPCAPLSRVRGVCYI